MFSVPYIKTPLSLFPSATLFFFDPPSKVFLSTWHTHYIHTLTYGRKSSVEECIFVYIAFHFECRFNKNSLLHLLLSLVSFSGKVEEYLKYLKQLRKVRGYIEINKSAFVNLNFLSNLVEIDPPPGNLSYGRYASFIRNVFVKFIFIRKVKKYS